jgi:hypothetical protein
MSIRAGEYMKVIGRTVASTRPVLYHHQYIQISNTTYGIKHAKLPHLQQYRYPRVQPKSKGIKETYAI